MYRTGLSQAPSQTTLLSLSFRVDSTTRGPRVIGSGRADTSLKLET